MAAAGAISWNSEVFGTLGNVKLPGPCIWDSMKEEHRQRDSMPGQTTKVALLSAKLGSILACGGHNGIGHAYVRYHGDGVFEVSGVAGNGRIRSYPAAATYKQSIDFFWDWASSYCASMLKFGKAFDKVVFDKLPVLVPPPNGTSVYVDIRRNISSYWDLADSCYGNGCVHGLSPVCYPF